MCEGFPNDFIKYVEYCRGLEFEAQPDYEYMRKIFANLFEKLEYKLDYEYDWKEVLEKNKAKELEAEKEKIVEKKKKELHSFKDIEGTGGTGFNDKEKL